MNYLRYIVARGLNRTSIELALDLIYAATDLVFPIDKVTLGVPSPITLRSGKLVEANTFVPIVKVSDEYDARYSPPAEEGALYYRIPFTLITPNADIEFTIPSNGSFTVYSILDKINEKLNVKFTENDLLDETYEASSQFIRLKANPKSWVWIGEYVLYASGFETLLSGRITEDGRLRLTEDGRIRAMEDAS